MLEKILEKVLERVVGEYVEGISNNQMKVGIWNGDIDISNIRLKSSLIKQLNVPFELKLGLIEKLKMKIPWKNIKTQAVEVNLDGLYVIISPMKQSQWGELKQDFIKNKEQFLLNYAKTLMDALTEKMNMQNKEKGYFTTIIQKVLDNLQVQVKNIHVRLESIDEPIDNFSLGATLDNLIIGNQDKEDGASKGGTVNKTLNIRNFFIYANAAESLFIQKKYTRIEEMYSIMKELIQKESFEGEEQKKKIEPLLNFSTIAQLKQQKLTKDLVGEGAPQYELIIELDKCDFNIQEVQVKKVGQVLTALGAYSKQQEKQAQIYKSYIYRPIKRIKDQTNTLERRKLVKEWWNFVVKAVTFDMQNRRPINHLIRAIIQANKRPRENFTNFFAKLFNSKNQDIKQILTNEEYINWVNLITTINEAQLIIWIQEYLKTLKKQEYLKREQGKKGGFMGFFGKQKELSQEEETRLHSFLDDLLSAQDLSNIELPEQYIQILANFRLKVFNIEISKRSILDDKREIIRLSIKNLQIKAGVKNCGLKVESTLQNIKLTYNTQTIGGSVIQSSKHIFCENKKKTFMQLLMEDRPPNYHNLDKYIELNIGQFNIIYSPQLLDTIVNIFSVDIPSDFKDELKIQSKKKIREAKDIGQAAMNSFFEQQLKMIINVEISSPSLILPIDCSQIHKSSCWAFYPGNLKACVDTYCSNNPQAIYDNIKLQLINIRFIYAQHVMLILNKEFISQNDFMTKGNVTQEDNDIQTIFQDFDISVDIKNMKNAYAALNLSDTRMIIKASLNDLRLSTTPRILKDLQNIPDILLVKEKNQLLSKKQDILLKATKRNFLNVKLNGQAMVLYVVYHLNDLYFYQNPKTDLQEQLKVSFDNNPLITLDSSSHSISIKSDKNIIDVIFDDYEQYTNWRNSMSTAINKIEERVLQELLEYEQRKQLLALKGIVLRKTEEEEGGEIEGGGQKAVKQVQLDFTFSNFVVLIQNGVTDYELSVKNLQIALSQFPLQMRVHLELFNFYLKRISGGSSDFILTSQYLQSLSSSILRDIYEQEQQQLIIIDYQMDEGKGDKKHKANILFGSLFGDLLPSDIKELMSLLLSSDPPSQKTQEDQKLNEGAQNAEDPLSIQFEQPKLTDDILKPYENNAQKMVKLSEAKPQFQITFRLQAVNVIFINSVKKIPVVDVIILNSVMKVKMSQGAICFEGSFSDISLYDLTNYPLTLEQRNDALIRPQKIFGKLDAQSSKPLIDVKYTQKDPLHFNISDTLDNSLLEVEIDNVDVKVYLQLVLRLINFLNEQLLPTLLQTDNPSSDRLLILNKRSQLTFAKKNTVTDGGSHLLLERQKSLNMGRMRQNSNYKEEFPYQRRRQAYINTYKPFWMRMDVKIMNTYCHLSINEHDKLTAHIKNLTIENVRSLNKERLIFYNKQHQEHLLEGIWNENYLLQFNDLCIQLDSGSGVIKQLTSPIAMSLSCEMPVNEQDLNILFLCEKLSNHSRKYMQTDMHDGEEPIIYTETIYYDGAMVVKVHFSPFILHLGTLEYGLIMKAIENSVTFNDGRDSVYIQDYILKQQTQEPSTIYIDLRIDRVGLVQVSGKQGNRPSAKVFVENLKVEMLMLPSGNFVVQVGIHDLKGFHLVQHGDRFYEKGFIGEFWIQKDYQAKSDEELWGLFLEDMVQESLKAKTGGLDGHGQSYVSVNFQNTQFLRSIYIDIHQQAILLQTDVLLSLLAIVQQPSGTQQQAQQTQQQAQQTQYPQQQITKVIVNIKKTSFLVPSSEFDYALIMQGDIALDVTLTPQKEDKRVYSEEEFVSAVQSEFKDPEEPELALLEDKKHKISQLMGMSILLAIDNIEVFLSEFINVFRNRQLEIPKRPLLMPFCLSFSLHQYILNKRSQTYADGVVKICINKLLMSSENIEFKLSVRDIELILDVINTQLVMLNGGSKAPEPQVKTPPVDKTIGLKQPQMTQETQLTFSYVSMNLLSLKVTVINDFSNIFAPTIIFRMKNLKVLSDIEEQLKLVIVLSLEVHYFNSEIFHWEPCLEKATLRLEYLAGKMLKAISVVNTNTSGINLNISIPLLDKVKFLTDTLQKIKIKNEEQYQKAKNAKIESYLKSILKEGVVKRMQAEPESFKDPLSRTYISPVRITNNTGYDITLYYYKKQIRIDDQGGSKIMLNKETIVELGDGESKPLSIEEQLEEYDDFADGMQQSISHKYISFKIHHPQFTFDQVKEINMVSNFSKKFRLAGKEKHLGDYKVICSSSNRKDIKDVCISSQILFVNRLSKEVSLQIKHPYMLWKREVQEGGQLYVPIDLQCYLAALLVEDNQMQQSFKFTDFVHRQPGYFFPLKTRDGKFGFVLKIYKEIENQYLVKVIALPQLTIVNRLPLQLQLRLTNGQDEANVKLEREEEFVTCAFDTNLGIVLNIKVPGFTQTRDVRILKTPKDRFQPLMVNLAGESNKRAQVNIIQLKRQYSHLQFAIFCNVVIVNETPFKFIYHIGSNHKHQNGVLGGGEGSEKEDFRIGLLGSSNPYMKLSLAQGQELESFCDSNTISTQGIIASSLMLYVQGARKGSNERYNLEIGYSSKLVDIDSADFVAAKVVHLSAKTIVYNQVEGVVQIAGNTKEAILLQPGEKVPIYLYKYSQQFQKTVSMKIFINDDVYENQTLIDFHKVGTIEFMSRNQRSGQFLVVRVEITLQNDYVFVTIQNRTTLNDFTIRNMTEYQLKILQQGSIQTEYTVTIPPRQTAEYAYTNPYAQKQITATLLLPGAKTPLANFHVKTHKISREKFKLKNIVHEITTDIFIENEHRVLEIKANVDLARSLVPTMSDHQEGFQHIKKIQSQTTITEEGECLKFDCRFTAIGISLIIKYQTVNKEAFFVFLNDIQGVALLTSEQQEVQLMIRFLNVDSNYSSDCKYPVLLTTTASQLSQSDSKFINFHTIINKNKNPKFISLDIFELEIAPLTLTAEYQLVNVIMSLKQQLDRTFPQQESTNYLMRYFSKKRPDTFMEEWKNISLLASDQFIYCKVFKVSMVKVTLSFSMTQYQTAVGKQGADDINVDLLVQTLGVTFINIDESPITLQGLRLESIFESMGSFNNIIFNHLKNQQNRNIAKVIGSVDIFGNPVQLFSNIGSGVVEFFEKPVTGFIKGPIEGVFGIAKGGSSLLKNTTAGAFNTISKISNSLAQGLTSLSMDKEYLKQRNLKRAQKPKNFIDGVGKGLASMGRGVFSGVTGVLAKPIAETKKDGTFGLMKGVVKGVTGLFTKSVGGIFDGASQTFEGMKKTITVFDDRPNDRRIRTPRVFYSDIQYFKSYNSLDSQIMKELQTIRGGKYEKDTFLDTIEFKMRGNGQENKKYIILTQQHLLLINEGLSEILLSIDINDITRLRYRDENEVSVHYKQYDSDKEIKITSKRSNIFKIINSINYCKHISSEEHFGY